MTYLIIFTNNREHRVHVKTLQELFRWVGELSEREGAPPDLIYLKER